MIELVEKDYKVSRAWWIGDPELPSERRIFVLWMLPKLGVFDPENIWSFHEDIFNYALPGSRDDSTGDGR